MVILTQWSGNLRARRFPSHVLVPTVPHAPGKDPHVGGYADRPWTGPDKRHAAQVTTCDTLVGDVTHWRLTRPQVSTATTLTCRGTARHGDDEVTYTATAPVS